MNLEDLLIKIDEDCSLDQSVEIAADTELLMSGVVDSLGIVTLVAWIEEQADIRIDPGDVVIENFDTPAAIMSLVAASTSPA